MFMVWIVEFYLFWSELLSCVSLFQKWATPTAKFLTHDCGRNHSLIAHQPTYVESYTESLRAHTCQNCFCFVVGLCEKGEMTPMIFVFISFINILLVHNCFLVELTSKAVLIFYKHSISDYLGTILLVAYFLGQTWFLKPHGNFIFACVRKFRQFCTAGSMCQVIMMHCNVIIISLIGITYHTENWRVIWGATTHREVMSIQS